MWKLMDKSHVTHMGPKESTGHAYLEEGKVRQRFQGGASCELLRWRLWSIRADIECGIGMELCQLGEQEKVTRAYNDMQKN